jgi:HNH endonuclease
VKSLRTRWTDAQKAIVAERYRDTPTKELAETLGKSVRAVQHMGQVLAIKKDAAAIPGRFTVGYTGKSDGEVVLRSKGKGNRKVYFCIRPNRRAVPLHRVLWEERYGKVPEGKILAFKDGNPLNCVLENIELTTRDEFVQRISLLNLDPEVVETIRVLATLKMVINGRDRKAREQEQSV